MHPTSRQPLGAPGLVGASFRLLFRHFGFLFPLAFVPALALALLSGLAAPPELPQDFNPASELPPVGAPLAIAAGLLNVVVGFAVSGVMALAAIDAVIGKRHTVRDYVGQVLRHLGPIVVLGLLYAIIAGIGFAMLILPGLYVVARFFPLVPAIVFEDAGWSGLNRAQELTKDYRWPIAGTVLLFGLALVASFLLIGPLAALAAAGGWLVAILFEAALSGLLYALVAIFTALLYARLREIREGVTTGDLATSID